MLYEFLLRYNLNLILLTINKKMKSNRYSKSDKRILNSRQIGDLLNNLTKINNPVEVGCNCNDFCEKCYDYINSLYIESLNEIILEYEFPGINKNYK
jgi:hypothetical protein